MLNEKRHQVKKRCVRKAGFLLRNPAFLCDVIPGTAKSGVGFHLDFEDVRQYESTTHH